MKQSSARSMLSPFVSLLLPLSFLVMTGALTSCKRDQPTGDIQKADEVFVPKVAKPAYKAEGPHVVIDEAHNNYHKAEGRYKPFVDLLTSDGYRVTSNRREFTPESLEGIDVLVISNASGGTHEDDPDAELAKPAFKPSEVAVVKAWVEGGGALLFIADHAPSGAAGQILATAFDVEMRNTWTYDENHGEPGYGKYNLAFTRESGLLNDHPITRGRHERERIDKVVTFTGQSLKGPAHSEPLLTLSDTAMDEDVTETVYKSAAGRVQGLTLLQGKGRVVILGEAAMMTAQQRFREGEVHRFGISYPHCDNQQFALNILHWLTGLLP
ncbi:hypothetical protein SCOR_31510 [Sulfidibacter corallicola]|uniref:DUF4350 domain-containing protein n=1 Tax=Sulfidibacter corallicola TaxID=2818388 RepID=A0A8A4TK12_SULCO|nr:hypothetical protein [Sulfidibacter corallicola]QTD49923.1 hypothetical protein J3U87_30445 [Sulfidibacter corallicola]